MFREITPESLEKTPFEMIGKDWMLITAGDENKLNTMTASWGAMGVLWNKNVLIAFVRPSRYTFDFLMKNEKFSCTFYKDEYRKALTLCGTKSGRDIDKVTECNFTPDFSQDAPFFDEADTVVICKKLYVQPMKSEFALTDEVKKNYNDDSEYHYVFVAEIEKVLKK